MLVLKGLVGLRRTSKAEDLDYCDVEWFALETNRDHSVVFEIAPKYCISVMNLSEAVTISYF